MYTPLHKPASITIYSLFIATLLTLCGLSSCEIETISDVENITAPSRLVLNGIINPDKDTCCIYLSDSKSLFDPKNSRKAFKYEGSFEISYWYMDPKAGFLNDATATIYKNDQSGSAIYPHPEDSVTYYIDQLKAGDKIRIEAEQNGRHISSTTVIPEKPVITSVDTASFYGYSYSSYYPSENQMLRLYIKIKDQPGTRNYYRLFTNIVKEVHLDPEYAKENDAPEIINYYYTGFFSEDPIITTGRKGESNFFGLDVVNYQQNYYNIFTDEMFEDREYTLNIYVPHPEKGYTPYYYSTYPYFYPEETVAEKVQFTLCLQAISKELYQYYSTLQKSFYQNQIEPVKIFNNIEGGLGIWGAVNEQKITVFEKQTIYTEQK